jgi:hypothetical protein
MWHTLHRLLVTVAIILTLYWRLFLILLGVRR